MESKLINIFVYFKNGLGSDGSVVKRLRRFVAMFFPSPIF